MRAIKTYVLYSSREKYKQSVLVQIYFTPF